LIRGIRGLQAVDLARLLDVTAKAIRNWENGKNGPNPLYRARLVEALGGVQDPAWDDVRLRELSLGLGARRAEQFATAGALPGIGSDDDPPDGGARRWVIATVVVTALVGLAVLSWRATDEIVEAQLDPLGNADLTYKWGEHRT